MQGQTCQVAVATAIFQKKSLVAVKNVWPRVAIKWP
jgi:hypothetical protein